MAFITKKEINKLFADIKRELSQVVPIPVNKIYPNLKYNRRTTAFGMCKRTLKDGMFQIYLSEYALDDINCIKNTLAHELIHTLPNCMNHGYRFMHYALLANRKLGYGITSKGTRSDSDASGMTQARNEKAKYKVVCNGCHIEVVRQRLSALIEHPEKYQCKICGSTFTRVN